MIWGFLEFHLWPFRDSQWSTVSYSLLSPFFFHLKPSVFSTFPPFLPNRVCVSSCPLCTYRLKVSFWCCSCFPPHLSLDSAFGFCCSESPICWSNAAPSSEPENNFKNTLLNPHWILDRLCSGHKVNCYISNRLTFDDLKVEFHVPMYTFRGLGLGLRSTVTFRVRYRR